MAQINPEQEQPRRAFGWAARDTSGVLSPFHFSRRETGEKDVTLRVLYCGICLYDLQMLQNHIGDAVYPRVPRHEIIGMVIETGGKVTKFKVGDKVEVGGFVGSCRSCDSCQDNLESYYPNYIPIYNYKNHDGTMTYGGCSNFMVCDEHFIIRIPDSLPLEACAPLLCAGITIYSAIRYYGLDKPGLHVGVVGFGNLGRVIVKFLKAMGVKVTVISTSPNKKQEAMQYLGADSFLISKDEKQLQVAIGTMDGAINIVPATHPLLPIIELLKHHGKLIILGTPLEPLELPIIPLLLVLIINLRRKMIGSSFARGLKETQKMMDFAGEHNIIINTQVIPVDYVNVALERIGKNDARHHFVLDIGNTLKA